MNKEEYVSLIMKYGVPKEEAEEIAEYFDFETEEGDNVDKKI